MNKKILVLDGRSLAALAIARSFGEKGLEVHSGDAFKGNVTSFSKYVKRTYVHSCPEKEPKLFLDDLIEIISNDEYEMVFPVRDATTLLLSKHYDDISEYTRVFIAEAETISVFQNKADTIKLAMNCGVPIPKTLFPENDDFQKELSKINFPILIRSRSGTGSRGIIYVGKEEDYDEAYLRIKEEHGPPIVQEYVDKKSYSTACVLIDNEKDMNVVFTYERVKEYPLSGGPTVVGIGTKDALVKRLALKILNAADFKGVAEVEFIVGKDGQPLLLEVNPRFWMPLNLAIKSGVDFPFLLYKLAKGESINQFDYKEDLVYRWVLPNEILWFIDDKDKINSLKSLFSSLKQKQTIHATFDVSDPLPVFGIIIQGLSHIFNKDKRKFYFERGW